VRAARPRPRPDPAGATRLRAPARDPHHGHRPPPPDRADRPPDKDRFLNEDNPFEAMMSRFDRAAVLLDLDPGIYQVLRHPEKQITISVPVMMDSGEVRVFTGHRVLYNTSRGPAKAASAST
jgi:hypothetical protein